MKQYYLSYQFNCHHVLYLKYLTRCWYKIAWKILLHMAQASFMPLGPCTAGSRTVIATSIYCGVGKLLQWSLTVCELKHLRFWPFVITHFNITVSTTHTWFWWTGMRPHGWWVGFLRSRIVQIILSSVKLFHYVRLTAFVHYGMIECILGF
jgi:hypothetical protein